MAECQNQQGSAVVGIIILDGPTTSIFRTEVSVISLHIEHQGREYVELHLTFSIHHCALYLSIGPSPNDSASQPNKILNKQNRKQTL
jgi:hypothetical protein